MAEAPTPAADVLGLRVDPTSYPIRIALAMRAPCASARDDAKAALRLAPGWPAPRAAMKRCG